MSEQGRVCFFQGCVPAAGPHLPRDDLLIDLDGLVCEEGRVASGHFIDKNPQGPPVHSLVVALEQDGGAQGEEGASRRAEPASGEGEGWGGAYFAQDNLRGQILRGAAQGPSAALHALGETEVCHLWAQEQAVGRKGGSRPRLPQGCPSPGLVGT